MDTLFLLELRKMVTEQVIGENVELIFNRRIFFFHFVQGRAREISPLFQQRHGEGM